MAHLKVCPWILINIQGNKLNLKKNNVYVEILLRKFSVAFNFFAMFYFVTIVKKLYRSNEEILFYFSLFKKHQTK